MQRTIRFKLLFAALGVLCLCATVNAQTRYDMHWVVIEGIQEDPVNNALLKTAPTGIDNATAKSSNIIEAQASGDVMFEIDDENAGFMMGLSPNNYESNYEAIAYAIHFSGGEVSVFENGELIGSYGSADVGTEFKVERDGEEIKYYKDGILLHTTGTDDNYELIVDVLMIEQNSTMTNITTSFKAPLGVSYTSTDITSTNMYGSVDLTVWGGEPPYQYRWSTGETNEDHSNLALGDYTVTVTDDYGDELVQTMSITFGLEWNVFEQNLTLHPDGAIEKTAGGISWYYSNARSANYVPAGGDAEVEWTIDSDEYHYMMIGFGRKTENPFGGYYAHKYLFKAEANLLIAFANNQSLGIYGRAEEGDHLRIKKENGIAYYYKNGTLVTQSPIVQEFDFAFHATVATPGMRIKDVSTDMPPLIVEKMTIDATGLTDCDIQLNQGVNMIDFTSKVPRAIMVTIPDSGDLDTLNFVLSHATGAGSDVDLNIRYDHNLEVDGASFTNSGATSTLSSDFYAQHEETIFLHHHGIHGGHDDLSKVKINLYGGLYMIIGSGEYGKLSFDGLEPFAQKEMWVFDENGAQVYYTDDPESNPWDGFINGEIKPGRYGFDLKLEGETYSGELFVINM